MVRRFKIALLIASAAFLTGCKPCLSLFDVVALDKEEKAEKRCLCDLQELSEECPQLLDSSAVLDTIPVSVPEIKVDTVVAKADTIRINKDRWRVQIVTKDSLVYVTGGVDSIVKYVPVEVPCPPRVKPPPKKERTWTDKASDFFIYLGVLCALILLILLIRIVRKGKV
jgi:hypothetical protein